MGNLKYKLTDEVMVFNGRVLHRIEALKDFGDVKAGTKGGWIQHECNLSVTGNCWVYSQAMVMDNAFVFGDAIISGHAILDGNARAHDNCRVRGNAYINGNGTVYGNANVEMRAVITGYGMVGDNAIIRDKACVQGDAIVAGSMVVGGTAIIGGCSSYYDYLYVFEGVYVDEPDLFRMQDDLNFEGIIYYSKDTKKVYIGAESFSLDEFIELGKALHIEDFYTSLVNTIKILYK